MERSRGKMGLLATTGLAWLALFLTSLWPRSPYFRPWEMLREGPVAFRPLTRVEMPGCGDLGRNSWVSDLQDWRWARFTTDATGLRNPPDLGWARIVVVGDSYVVGSGVGDDETIPAAMGRALGEPVYNYGCVAGLGPLAYLTDLRASESAPDVVVWAPASRTVEPFPLGPVPVAQAREASDPASRAPVRDFLRSGWSRWASAGASVAAWKARFEERSALTALSRSLFHESYWRLTGRPWEIRAIEVDGRPALVMTLEAQGLCSGPAGRRLAETVEAIDLLRQELSRRGSRFVFAPIPDTGTLYADCYTVAERALLADPPFIDLVFRDLAARGAACADLRPALRENLEPYLFLRDDTHLGPRGTELVARALAQAVRTVLAERR